MGFLETVPYPYLSATGSALVVYLIAGAIYRLYLRPVAKFPGPKLAALTLWYGISIARFQNSQLICCRYEFYYDVVCRGQYTFQIKRMHEKYGPIVRINPYELHIETPGYYDEIYAGGGKRRDKWNWFTNQFGIPESTFATASHEKHRMRRTALNPFFSMASVRRLQPMIEERLEKFLGRFADFQKSGEPMVVSLGYAAFTNGTCDPRS
jgi:hypothetical protein